MLQTKYCFQITDFEVKFQMSVSFFCMIMSPQPLGGGTYCLWCGSRLHLISLLSALCLLNQWMDLDQT